MPPEIICLLIWEVWRSRNAYIFQDIPVFVHSTFSKVCFSPSFPVQCNRGRICRSVKPCPIIQAGNMGYFDEAAKDGMCGAGMLLCLENSSTFKLRMDAGRGCNTKAELLALWGLLYFASLRMVPNLKILGDSKFIIDWMLEKHHIHVIELDHWMIQVKSLKAHFTNCRLNIFIENTIWKLMIYQRRLWVLGPA